MTVPRATYRLQLHEEFTLRDAQRIVPYLASLGISHLYLSPIAQATPGSAHGYDVTDPTQVAGELGGEAALQSLAATLHAHDMGILLDIVPNHMAASAESPWWADLLERGAASAHADVFDTPLAHGDARLCLPVLGAPIDEVVASGELTFDEREGRPILRYHDRWFPLPPGAGDAVHDVRDAASLRALLAKLPYELRDWRCVADTVCYRRFFDITDLVGVRVEDPAVFERTHAGILRWLENDWIDGLRIDHIDGLRDPAAYLDQLGTATAHARDGLPCYTVVEKILAPDELVPIDWRTEGATGYEFARVAVGLLVDRSGYARLDHDRGVRTGEQRDLTTFVHDCKRLVLDTLFRAELSDVADRLTALVPEPREAVAAALRELTVALAVYRTYISEAGASADDRRRIADAHALATTSLAIEHRPALDAICEALLLDGARVSETERVRALDAVARWQQLTGPVMAKGFEDTALYAWPALLALNDVGGEPGAAIDPAEAQAFFAERARLTPRALNATSTHDTKRSEDVRARLAVLSEHARAWTDTLDACLPALSDAVSTVSPRDRLTLLQTIVGAWPLDADPDRTFTGRIEAFMRKAAREAKLETSWIEPDAAYEEALDRTVRYVLEDDAGAPVRARLHDVVKLVELHGAVNALALGLLRCTAPGIPDTYQGTERWRFDLVDPDNRRAVDFDRLAESADLRAMLDAPSGAAVESLRETWRDGRIKQYVLMAALACRRRNDAFQGAYLPLVVSGALAASALAFRRTVGASQVVAVVTRLPARVAAPEEWPIGARWGDCTIEVGADTAEWRCVLTGQRVRPVDGHLALSDVLRHLPVALVERTG